MLRLWNVVVSVNNGGLREAVESLHRFGPVAKTEFFNVLVVQAENPQAMLDTLVEEQQSDPRRYAWINRVVPVKDGFLFQSPAEFDTKARERLLALLPKLAGKRFHVRVHRRGFKGRLAKRQEEQKLARFLLESLSAAGTNGHIDPDDPDAVVDIETVAQQAGVALWTRDQLQRYPFVRPD
jgi:tRNA(Ser,Leu) C12 N-acetylase TAN1